ncbi:MAG TPA: flavodoxin domain-containing protein, partial [Desulfuromonadales bacterium]|nr:flavodoxin domain-containing protein [Desulfuromonadales bacterium]
AHSCGEGLYDDESSDFSGDFAHYYDTIMRPFKKYILDAVAKVEGLPLRLICPSHGPLLRRAPRQAIDSYRKWSTLPATEGQQVLVLTISPHGNTRAMAAVVRKGLEEEGLTVVEKSIYGTSDAELRDAMELADALVVASPTVNRDAPPPVWHALSLLSTVTPRGRQAAVFGSYGWSGEAIKLIEERLKGLKFTLVVPGLSFRFKPTADDEKACLAFGRAVGAAVAQNG